MKIISAKPHSVDTTYTLEVDNPSHNYLVDVGGTTIVSRNSHATAYIVLTYRSLFLKAHFAPEWWAAVMSGCHRDKLPKFISTAKAEGIKFGDIDVNALSPTFTVSGDTVAPGILSIKGVGDSIVSQMEKDKKFDNVDEFVEHYGKCKVLAEPVIKMGGFNHQHSNKKAVWHWYLYNHGDKSYRKMMRHCYAWPKDVIDVERTRLASEFKALYPRRKKMPPKIANWVPTTPWHTPTHYVEDMEISDDEYKLSSKIELTFDNVLQLFSEDYSLSEILRFEKEVLGYFWHSPLDVFAHDNTKNIRNAKASSGPVDLHCVIEKAEKKETPKSLYYRLAVTDGIDKATVMVWADVVDAMGDMATDILESNTGVSMEVVWQPNYRSFNIAPGACIIPLLNK